MNGKKKLIITMAIALILLVGVTISYGYIALVSTSKNQEMSVSTGNIHLVFDDADTDNVNAKLQLGQSITKTFKIENKGTKSGKVQINWKNLINTYNSRSLSYTLESSSNKTSGYTSVETIRDNVPVSTEAKDVPLSKKITIPVSSAPIYYKLTITFNNLSDVDQSEDVNATLTTQFSLSEPENISKKVIAVLNGNVKTNQPDFFVPEPRKVYEIEDDTDYGPSHYNDANNSLQNMYLYYSDEYKLEPNGNMTLINPQNGKYADVYTQVQNKWVWKCHSNIRDKNEKNCYANRTALYKYVNTTPTSYDYYTFDPYETGTVDLTFSGVYKAEDDYGESYYYRGGVDNNYFKFGGLFWRIIRINGDGSLRLIYAGTKAHPNREYIDAELSIGNLNISKRTAGYMMGIDESTDAYSTSKQEADRNTYDSPLKKAIDTWYETNLKTNAANGNKDMGIYLSDTLFCSDRSVAPSANLWDENDTALGYGKNQTVYGSNYRISNGTPTLKCPLKNDRFTVSDTKVGNGALKYKIATITGDEMMMAGVTREGSANSGKDYLRLVIYGIYTMSPGNLLSSSSATLLEVQRTSDSLTTSNLYTNMRGLPVINISSEYALKVIGTGTMTDPYVIPGVN